MRSTQTSPPSVLDGKERVLIYPLREYDRDIDQVVLSVLYFPDWVHGPRDLGTVQIDKTDVAVTYLPRCFEAVERPGFHFGRVPKRNHAPPEFLDLPSVRGDRTLR